MKELPERLPDADLLLRLPPEEIGMIMVEIAQQNSEPRFMPELTEDWFVRRPGRTVWPTEKRYEIVLAINEAWAWVQQQGLFVRDPGFNGRHGWLTLSRRGRQLVDVRTRLDFVLAQQLPKALIHKKIQVPVWESFLRSEYDVAVFQAMKAVEVAVREEARLSPKLVGVSLMREAFKPVTGPLSDLTVEVGEQEARMHFFAGAIGSYKNPQSHRRVDLTDPTEAIEQVMLASHLLRIVYSS